MPYDRWFNNPLVLYAAFNGVEKKVYANKPEFDWTEVPLLDNSADAVRPAWIKKLGNQYVAALDINPYGGGSRKALYCSSNPTSGWQLGAEESYSVSYDDSGPLSVCTAPCGLAAVGLHAGENVQNGTSTCYYFLSWSSGASGGWSKHKIHYKWIYEDEEGETVERESDLFNEPAAVAYGGAYVICFWMGNRLGVLSSAVPNPEYWEMNAPELVGTEQEIRPSDMIYADGHFVVCGHMQTDIRSINATCLPFIATASNPMGDWSFSTIDNETCYIYRLKYQNGMFTAFGSGGNKSYVFFAPSAGGPWSKRCIADFDCDGDVVYADGYWLIAYEGHGEYENPIDWYNPPNVLGEHIAITDDLATGRLLKCRYTRDPCRNFTDFEKSNGFTFAERMCFDNGKLMMISTGQNLLVADFPFEHMDQVYP